MKTGYVDNFERQIKFLKKHFNFCYPEDYFSGNSKKGINILITFDDGYKDNYDLAAPILKRFEAPSIFFLATNYIGVNDWLWHDKVRYLIQNGALKSSEAEGHLRTMNLKGTIDPKFKLFVDSNFPKEAPKRMMMNWEEVRKLNEMSLRIGAHTCNHLILTELNTLKQHEEIDLSSKKIESITEKKCDYIAYPNGLYNTDTISVLHSLNLSWGFTTESGVNMINTEKTGLKRIGMNASDNICTLLLKITLNTIR
ncbi:polysaccharide deacetylase family protein [Lutimonas vermicola]|uniref:Polysaccharide deacetylase family protein n=1 Tax=Lutimonas vermicola TaxID=414288 RepID=A0ABU9L403_9FLAO